MRAEFDLRESLSARAPEGPIEFSQRLRTVRVELDSSASPNNSPPKGPIEKSPGVPVSQGQSHPKSDQQIS